MYYRGESIVEVGVLGFAVWLVFLQVGEDLAEYAFEIRELACAGRHFEIEVFDFEGRSLGADDLPLEVIFTIYSECVLCAFFLDCARAFDRSILETAVVAEERLE